MNVASFIHGPYATKRAVGVVAVIGDKDSQKITVSVYEGPYARHCCPRFLVVFLISPAAGLTGNGLQEYCSGPEGSSKSLACTLYVSGFLAGIRLLTALKENTRMWCFPDGSTIGQSRLIIEKYMRDNPQSLHQDASVIAGKALLFQPSLANIKTETTTDQGP